MAVSCRSVWLVKFASCFSISASSSSVVWASAELTTGGTVDVGCCTGSPLIGLTFGTEAFSFMVTGGVGVAGLLGNDAGCCITGLEAGVWLATGDIAGVPFVVIVVGCEALLATGCCGEGAGEGAVGGVLTTGAVVGVGSDSGAVTSCGSGATAMGGCATTAGSGTA